MESGRVVDVAFAVDKLAGVGQILRGAARKSMTEETARAWATAFTGKRR